MKFAYATVDDLESADSILFGVPDESCSNSPRKGTKLAPLAIRKISNEKNIFRIGLEEEEEMQTSFLNLYDYGNLDKDMVSDFVLNLVSKGKFFVCIGGDHTITTEILKGINNAKRDIAVIYLDAHPDLVVSNLKYFGDFKCELLNLDNVNKEAYIEIGTRSLETQDIFDIKKKYNIKTITSVQIAEQGIRKTWESVKRRLLTSKAVYLSVNLDVVDPSQAPGVSLPEPCGITSNELIYLCKKIAGIGNLVGCDIMEVNPPHDIHDMTTHLASKVITEILGSLRQKK